MPDMNPLIACCGLDGEKYGTRIGIAEVKALAKKCLDTDTMMALVDRIHDDDPHVARDAAWVMTHFTTEQVALLQPRMDEFIDVVLQTDNGALRRLLLNIVERLTTDEENLRSDFLDFCLAHMAAPDEHPGVQTLCMKLAYRQCSFYPELLNEFRLALTLMPPDGYAVSVKGLRRKMLRRLDE